MMKHGERIGVARDDPFMQKRIPVYRVFAAQPVIERVGICHYLRVKQLIEAEGLVVDRKLLLSLHRFLSSCSGLAGQWAHAIYPNKRRASSSLMVSTQVMRRRSISAASWRTVGVWKRVRSGSSRPKESSIQAMSCAPSIECPPR